MNASGFVAPIPTLQDALDRADASYLKVALEFCDFQYAEPEAIYDALMDAWGYVIDSLIYKPEGY